MMRTDTVLAEGERVGRYVVLRDRDGRLHAVAPGGVGAVCEVDDGTLVMLPAGRMIHIEHTMSVVLGWLDGNGPAR